MGCSTTLKSGKLGRTQHGINKFRLIIKEVLAIETNPKERQNGNLIISTCALGWENRQIMKSKKEIIGLCTKTPYF